MKKINNKGITLIELLVSMAILSIFMVTVSFFITSSSKSAKQTKQQINVQQDAKEAYDRLSDIIMQSTSVRIQSSEGTGISQYISDAAMKSAEYALAEYGSLASYTNDYFVQGVGNTSVYKKNTFGVKVPTSKYVSMAEYDAAVSSLKGEITEENISNGTVKVFDKDEHEFYAISTGPIDTGNNYRTCYTIIYDKGKKTIYMNSERSGITDDTKLSPSIDSNFVINEDNVIATNCESFKIKANGGDANSIELNMTFSNAGYSYTVGGTVNIRNSKVMD